MRTSQRFSRSRLVVAACTPVFSALVVEIYLRFFFDRQDPFLRAAIFLPSRWDALAWQLERTHTLLPIVVLMVGVSLLAMALGRWRGRDWSEALQGVGRANLWSLVLLAQQSLVLLVGPLAGGNTWDTLLTSSVLLAFSLAPAGWLAGLWNTACPAQVAFIEPAKPFSARAAQTKLAGAVATYVVVFSTLSILQYQALHVPHGDTGMYEEHLWNFLHGNGFRSQLDDGRLFLGEHFQVSHLLLLPVYVLWPCLPTLNVCQSLALASGAIAIYAIAQERGLTPTIAWTLGLAYLLYDPLHYLNLEASWKTFRPTTLGVPCLFFAFWAFEAHRYRTMLVLLGLSFLAKEEYALVIAGTGILLALRRSRGPLGKREILLGGTICVVGLVLLWLAVSVFIPYCRGAAPHYTTPYFGSLGDSPSAIVRYVLTHPLTVARRLAEPAKLQFLFLLLLPLGFLPLASPSRLLLALPILGYLMLGDLPMLTQLWFQFHAPVVPVVWWAGTVGVSCLRRWLDALHLARLLACLALTTGFWLGRTPLSWRFYDPDDRSCQFSWRASPARRLLARRLPADRPIPRVPPGV